MMTCRRSRGTYWSAEVTLSHAYDCARCLDGGWAAESRFNIIAMASS